LPDVANAVGGILRCGSPQNGQPGTGLTGSIGVGPLATFIGSAIGGSANDSDKSAASVSGNNLLGGPDTSEALELPIRLGNVKIRI
jgi:hypothetical protein